MKNSNERISKKYKTVFFLTAVIIWLTLSLRSLPTNLIDTNLESLIEKNILREMERGKIPGLSVVIVKKNKAGYNVYKKGFGFANISKGKYVTSKTLFELGSNSKAFTALGILLLKHKGLLGLEDPVSKHIPWFSMKYKGNKAAITIQQLLNHTSGIPFETIADIPVSNDKNALEDTVRRLVNKELNSEPGQEYAFATINYDVLGLIIEKVSGQSFEYFMKNELLGPLDLKNTYLSRDDVPAGDMAVGYKIGFFAAREYEAPVYRGNTPAAYFISNARDMEKWLKLQLGALHVPGVPEEIIEESHEPIGNFIGFRCAKGWFVFRGEELFHAGSNPTFSSFIVLSIPDKIGIALLANINSSLVEGLGWDILALVQGKKIEGEDSGFRKAGDFYINIDRISIYIIFPVFLLLCASGWFIFVKVKKILKNKGKPVFTRVKITAFVFATLVLIGIIYFLSRLPVFLSYELPWKLIRVWAPKTFVISVFLAGITAFSLYIFSFLMLFFPKYDMDTLEDKK